MHFAFQDFENLYLVMDLLTGGDLRYHIAKHKHFNEEQTSNYSLYIIFLQNFLLRVSLLDFHIFIHRTLFIVILNQKI